MAPTFRGMAVSVKKARSQGSSPPPGCRKRKLPRRSWKRGAMRLSPNPVTALGKREDEGAGADAILVRAADATTVANEAEIGVGGAEPATAKPRRPLLARKGAIGIVLLTGVAAAAIMVLKWPHALHPQAVVEPGMLADQPAKVMAPSAALAMVPPREEANVAAERPQVRATRGDEVQEVLSFKEDKATVSPPAAPAPTPSPAGASVTFAKPAVPMAAPPPPSAVPTPSPVSSVADGQPTKVASVPTRPLPGSGSRSCPAGRPSAYPGSSRAWSWRGGEDRVAPWRARGGDKGTVERAGYARRCR